MSIRENMLVTMGARAGSMEALGYIDLPEGSCREMKKHFGNSQNGYKF